MSCSRGCCATQAEHFRSLRFVSAGTVVLNRKDDRLSKDLAAYKRLTESGLEPARIDGCHDWERTDASADVIEGRLPSPPPQT